MKLENIEKARVLIAQRNKLIDVLEKSEGWKSGHFEFAEHCGHAPDRISITCFPELQSKIMDVIREEVKRIECKLQEL